MKKYDTVEDDTVLLEQELQVILERNRKNQLSKLEEYLDNHTFESIKKYVTFFYVGAQNSDAAFKYMVDITLDLYDPITRKVKNYHNFIKRIEHEHVTEAVNDILKRVLNNFILYKR